jgi:hypothetical protein
MLILLIKSAAHMEGIIKAMDCIRESLKFNIPDTIHCFNNPFHMSRTLNKKNQHAKFRGI